MSGDDPQIIQNQNEDKREILDVESEQENPIGEELQKVEKAKMSKTKKLVILCTSLILLVAIGTGQLKNDFNV